MVFGGLQKHSLIDYPGKLSCVLFLSGCNFDCPYCHNPDLVTGRSGCLPYMDGDSVYNFLKSRTGLLDGVVISGGEPTLHKNLSLLCEMLKLMGYAVKLDTNGSRPRVIKRLMEEGLVDYIAMDIKTDPYHYPTYINKNGNPDHILDSIQVILGSSVGYEFRTTCAKRIVDASIVEKIAKIIKGARLYALQRFHGTEILHPEFFQESEGGYDDNEMLFLSSIAKPWVKKCIVR